MEDARTVAELTLHGSTIETVFDLLGHRENDMTFALGWGLSRSDAVLQALLARIAPGVAPGSPVVVELQEYDVDDRGFTDVEISTPTIHAVIEAKRGWDPPTAAQLCRYQERLAHDVTRTTHIVILTQNGAEPIVRHQLAEWAPPTPIEAHVLGWSDVVQIALAASHAGPLAERRLAAELASYLRGVADMRNTESNSVYVVSLSSLALEGWSERLSTIDLVEHRRRYFFPATGKNWPKTPPNYVAFRYRGRLQSVHHVDDYVIARDLRPFFPGAPDTSGWPPHFVLTLGPAIRPPHEMRAGPRIVRSMRAWIDLDLLLTSSTITEAHALSRARRAS
jgi:hypothetical protein